MSTNLHIAILEDHPLIIKGLITLLNKYTFVSKVEGFADAETFIEYINQNHIDVALLDLRIKGEEVGCEVADYIKKNVTRTKVLIYSAHDETAVLNKCVKIGVDAYVTKDCNVIEIKKALISLMNEKKYFTLDIQQRLSKETDDHPKIIKENQEKSKLSTREVEIIKLICAGNNYKQISEKLFISANTVRKHRQNIMRKTNTHNIQELYKYALSMSIIIDK